MCARDTSIPASTLAAQNSRAIARTRTPLWVVSKSERYAIVMSIAIATRPAAEYTIWRRRSSSFLEWPRAAWMRPSWPSSSGRLASSRSAREHAHHITECDRSVRSVSESRWHVAHALIDCIIALSLRETTMVVMMMMRCKENGGGP